MATEQYSIGYEEGYQAGWNAAMESLPAPVQQEPVARYFEQYQGQPIEEIDGDRFNQTPDECRFKLYTSPPAQRKPLTFEQQMRIHNECCDSIGLAIALTEAAHGIKEST